MAVDTEDATLLSGSATIDGIGTAMILDIDVDMDPTDEEPYDLVVYTDEDGNFSFKPVGLVASDTASFNIRPRVGTGLSAVYGEVQPITVDFSSAALPATAAHGHVVRIVLRQERRQHRRGCDGRRAVGSHRSESSRAWWSNSTINPPRSSDRRSPTIPGWSFCHLTEDNDGTTPLSDGVYSFSRYITGMGSGCG